MNPISVIKHSVVIISYNQEGLIGRAIESLLVQSKYIYEIIVADDCSTDNTCSVVKSYMELYPGLFRLYKNKKNLGIFGNIENSWDKPNGNIIWYLAGDDIYCNGLFLEANKLIEANNLNLESDAFTLYFDFIAEDPNKKKKVYRNKLVRRYDPISLKIRQLIWNRTTGVSRSVFDMYYHVKKDVGIMTDGLIDIQTQLFSKKSFYSPFIGSVYFSNIGVSSKAKSFDLIKSYILSLDQLKVDILDISQEDLNWISYLQRQLMFKLNPDLINFKVYFKFYLKIIVVDFGLFFILRETKNVLRDFLQLIKFRS